MCTEIRVQLCTRTLNHTVLLGSIGGSLLKQEVFIHIDYSMDSNRGLAYHVVEVTCLECLYLLAAQCLREVILLEAGKHNSHLLKTDITCNIEQSLRILSMTRKCCKKVQLQHNGQGRLQGPTTKKSLIAQEDAIIKKERKKKVNAFGSHHLQKTKGGHTGYNECFFRPTVHRKSQTTRRAKKIPLRMPKTLTKALSNTCEVGHQNVIPHLCKFCGSVACRLFALSKM